MANLSSSVATIFSRLVFLFSPVLVFSPTQLFTAAVKRGVAPHSLNKEFGQQFQNYAPPSLRVIRTKFARTIIYIIYTRNVLPSAQMGERASVVLICIITSRYNEVK